MIACTKTIQLLHDAAVHNDVYQLLRQEIQLGWPERAADVRSNCKNVELLPTS